MASDPTPVYDDADEVAPTSFRWGVPLVIGLAVGGLVGGLAVFATMRMSASRTQSVPFAAEQFDFNQVLATTPGFAEGQQPTDDIACLGREDEYGPATDYPAVRRRITLNRPLLPSAKPDEVVKNFRSRIEAEFARIGAPMTGGGSSATWSGNEYQLSWYSGYTTRDRRRGRMDLELDIRNGWAKVVLILTEGR